MFKYLSTSPISFPIIFGILVLMGCKNPNYDNRGPIFLSTLVPHNAKEIRYSHRDSLPGVGFIISEKYPSTRMLAYFDKELTQRGYRAYRLPLWRIDNGQWRVIWQEKGRRYYPEHELARSWIDRNNRTVITLILVYKSKSQYGNPFHDYKGPNNDLLMVSVRMLSLQKWISEWKSKGFIK